jgi:high-affinity iron transporter
VITLSDCGKDWKPPRAGVPTFTLHNTTSDAFEIQLFGADGVTVFGRIEMLAPDTQRPLRVSLPPGTYTWRCQDYKGAVNFSPPGVVTGGDVAAQPYRPVTNDEMVVAVVAYRTQVAAGLKLLASDSARLLSAAQSGNTDATRAAWLDAHRQYERLGAAYDTFGDFADAIDGRPDGLPGGVHDKAFTGFHRLEYALWHNEDQATVVATAQQLDHDVRALVAQFPHQGTGSNDVPLRTHEILENSLQFELTGATDEGSHTNLATVRANVDATLMALSAITPMLRLRNPALLRRSTAALDALAAMLDRYDTGGTWRPLTDLTRPEREQLNAATSAFLETVSPVPAILERDPNDLDA